jgi:hypothetical protein
MAPRTVRLRRPDAGRLFAAVLAGLFATAIGGAAQAQGISSNEPRPFYWRERVFYIPFTVDPGDQRIRQVKLFVSEDNGRTYQYVSSVVPGEKRFRYSARGDGWYWFTVQTEDQDGKLTPADLSTAQPGLKVCVDTRPPVVVLRPIATREYPLAFEWNVQDENSGLDLSTLRAAYRPAGVTAAPWIDLPVQQVANGQQSWVPVGNAQQYEVRLQVRDRATNIGEGLITLTASGPGRTNNAAANIGTPVDPSQPPVKMVNKKRIQFNFNVSDVGPSKVKEIEVWYIVQGRGGWQKYEKAYLPDAPFEIEVEGEGRYGFTLVAVSGVGHAESRPQAGDLPQVWVEVDLTPPAVQLIGVEVGTGPEKGTVNIEWRATDRFLAAQPITLSYGTADGQWVPIASNIANSGRYVWRMPEGLPYQFPIRVDAIDQAGNVGTDKTKKDVIVDLSIPKARVIGVEGVKAAP